MDALTPYGERLKATLERPGLIDDVFAHMANGGDLIGLSQTLDIRYSDLAAWLMADKERAQHWTRACQAGDEWLRAKLLREAKMIASVDIRDIYNEDGSMKAPKDWPEHIARAIAAVETDELWGRKEDGPGREQIGWTKKVKFWSKDKMIIDLGKQVGLFNPVQKHLVSERLEDLVAGSHDQPAA